MQRSRTSASSNHAAHDQPAGRCRISRRAERVMRPGRASRVRRRVLATTSSPTHAQPDGGDPAQQVVRQGGNHYRCWATAPATPFCDTDPANVTSIQGWATTHGIQGVDTVVGDGVTAVRARVMPLDRPAAARALVFLDPYQPFEVIDELDISAVDFLAELATSGLPALLWYGFDHASRPTTQGQLRTVMDAAGHQAVWCAEMVPSYLEDPRFPFHSGFVGCGLVGVNLSATAVRACAAYGRGLERVYRDAVALGRYDGSLHYQQIA
jgi:hypothetical protein